MGITDIPKDWTPEEEQGYQGMRKGIQMTYDLILDDLKTLENFEHFLAYQRVLNIIRTLGKPDTQVPKWETDLMRMNRKEGLSIGQIAFIYHRSKSTVQHHVKHVHPLTLEEKREIHKENGVNTPNIP